MNVKQTILDDAVLKREIQKTRVNSDTRILSPEKTKELIDNIDWNRVSSDDRWSLNE